MGDLVAKLIAVWLAGLSPDGGAPATFVSNHDGDSIKVGFACTGPVTATISFSGLSLVQAPAGVPPLTLTVPCGKGGVVPMDLRVSGIDTPEIAAHCAREKAKALEARNAVTSWLRSANRITLHDPDIVSEKYGRTLGRLEFSGGGETGGAYDLGAKLILTGNAVPYFGGTKKGWCQGAP